MLWGAHAPRVLVSAPSPKRTSMQQFIHRFETRSFPISLVAYPRDFAFYVADPISSIHRSSRINWIRVDSCLPRRSLAKEGAFVVTTSLGPWRVRIQGGQISGITSRLFRR